MRRDMDKVREMLLMVEAGDRDMTIETESGTVDSHHLWLARDAGFVDSPVQDFPLRGDGRRERWMFPRLTWQGAEFLDSIRDDSSWSKVKQTIWREGQHVSFMTIKQVVAVLVKQSFGG